MKLKELFLSLEPNDVIKTLLWFVPDEAENIIGYQQALHEIDCTEERGNSCGYRVTARWVGRHESKQLTVELEHDNLDIGYSLLVTDWRDLVGCEVSEGALNIVTKEILAAHVLFEMTFIGFSNEIARKIDGVDSPQREPLEVPL